MAMTLIALVLLLIGIVAMLRSVDTASTLVGNLAFRRDLTNRAESAFAAARTAFVSGALNAEAARSVDQPASNYSALKLQSPAGIPAVLVSDSAYKALYGDPATSKDGITLRWVIDRQCLAAGAFSTGSCEFMASSGDAGGTNWLRKPLGASRPIYRISVRVSGPHSTEAYFQASYVD